MVSFLKTKRIMLYNLRDIRSTRKQLTAKEIAEKEQERRAKTFNEMTAHEWTLSSTYD